MRTQFFPRLVLVWALLAFACNAPFIPQAGGGGGRLDVVAPVQPLLSPEAYAAAAIALGEAIAELNRVQEQTLEHLRTSPTPEVVDADLVQTSAAAMTVAQLAEELAASTASQNGGGEQATNAALPYLTAAQLGYLTVIQTQNIREQYKAGQATNEDVSTTIGEGGSRLLSGDNFDLTTEPAPFASAGGNQSSVPAPAIMPPEATTSIGDQVDDTSGKETDLSSWASSTEGTQMVRVSVPAPAPGVRGIGLGLDPSQLDAMRRPEGQADADVVRLAAATKLMSLGADRSTGQAPGWAVTIVGYQNGAYILEITLPAALVFQSQSSGRALPYFPGGQAQAISTANAGGPLVSPVNVVEGQPQVAEPLEVTTAQPAVTLEITDAASTGTGGPDTRDVLLTVTWSTAMTNPAFTLACFTGSGQSASTPITSASGETSLTLTFSRQQDTSQCLAKTPDLVTTLGASQIIALEAEAAPPTVAPVTGGEPTQPPAVGGQTFAGSFSLTQADNECIFSSAPATGGTIEIIANFESGTASGSLDGAGDGVRTALECTGNFGDLTWTVTYGASFSGTVDAGGNLNMTGTLSGTGFSTWSNCHDAAGQAFDCPEGESNPYSYPLTVTGSVDQGAGTGSGAFVVSVPNLATNGSWTVP